MIGCLPDIGGERVLEQILNLFPNADLYYLFGKPSQVLKLKNKHNFFRHS